MENHKLISQTFFYLFNLFSVFSTYIFKLLNLQMARTDERLEEEISFDAIYHLLRDLWTPKGDHILLIGHVHPAVSALEQAENVCFNANKVHLLSLRLSMLMKLRSGDPWRDHNNVTRSTTERSPNRLGCCTETFRILTFTSPTMLWPGWNSLRSTWHHDRIGKVWTRVIRLRGAGFTFSPTRATSTLTAPSKQHNNSEFALRKGEKLH